MRLASHTSIPAPTGGLNDRDNIAEMKSTDAVVLDNWFPYPSYVSIRKGTTNHVTGFTAPVETIAEYLPANGTPKLFAASGTSIFDATATGAVGAAVQTGLANARWQDTQITTPGGAFLYMVNGVDSPRLFNGTTWTAVTGASSPAITGVTTSTLIHVCLFKSRLFFTQANSLNLYYLPTNSVGGAASLFDLGSVFRMGGQITACYAWTIDAGSGSDDHFVVITNQGEVAVYRGTDPSLASTWALIGVFNIGNPLGRRCGVKMGGDLLINCQEGVFPLSKALQSATINRQAAITDKIQNSISSNASLYGANFGWQLELFADENMLILNVPAGNGQNYQFAQNTITGSWCKFTGWDARAWKYAYNGLYYGDSNSIKKAWQGNADITSPIVGYVVPAFAYFGNRAANKYFTMVRPYFQSTGNPGILYAINQNFALTEPQGVLSFTPPTGMFWGSMFWGSMVWGGQLKQFSNSITVGAICYSASLGLKISNNASEVRLSNIDYLFNKGGWL